jgi:phenylalanyl-tRNA synthetase beta chain
VLPDRAHDVLSHVGVARELAVLEDRMLLYPFEKLAIKSKKTSRLKVEIKDKNLCFRYIGVVMENIRVGQSPEWMKARLKKLGINAINNIVDATNYVMVELGQPMHAFDFDVIKNSQGKAQILVRRARKKEKLTLLDGSIKELSGDDLVIANDKKALALAGIMGGADSGISENTTTVVLESANFSFENIRKTRTRLEVRTESSDRYEKEIDPNLTEKAMARLIEILEQFGGKVNGVVDVYPRPVKPWTIILDPKYVNNLLGVAIPLFQVVKILALLGLKVKKQGKFLKVVVPTFRVDLKTQEDLIEEVGRIYDYSRIQPQAPLAEVQVAKPNEFRAFERVAKNVLVSAGFSEVFNYSFYGQRDAELAQLGMMEHFELANPMNPDQALLRVNLIPNLLKNIQENLKNFSEVRIFESGRVFWRNGKKMPEEKRMLVGAVVIDKDEDKKKENRARNFFEAKGVVDILLDQLGMSNYYYDNFESVPNDTPVTLWHEGRTAQIKIEDRQEAIGYLGEISPLVLTEFDIHKRVAMFELDLEVLLNIAEREREYRPLRKYPTSERDISLVAPGGVRVDDILQNIQFSGGKLVLDADLFDIYDFEDGTTSFAFHIVFGAEDRTLESQEVDGLMQAIGDSLKEELKVTVRQ